MKLANPCKCDACTVGCRHGSGFLADEDIPKLAKFMGISEEILKKEFLQNYISYAKMYCTPKITPETQ